MRIGVWAGSTRPLTSMTGAKRTPRAHSGCRARRTFSSRSVSAAICQFARPATASTDSRNARSALWFERAMATTTATPTAMPRSVSAVRVFSRTMGRRTRALTSAPIDHLNHIVAVRRRALRVRGHHNGRPLRAVNLADELEDPLAGARVEVPGRLVREDECRAVDDGAPDGDALHLAAGELVRVVRGARAEADVVEDLARALGRLGAPHAGEREREGDVLDHVQRRDQVEELEDEADRRAAQHRQRALVERRGLDVVEADAAARLPGDRADQIQQRRPPRARGAHEHREVARGDVERDVVEDVEGGGFLRGAVRVTDVIEPDAHGGE